MKSDRDSHGPRPWFKPGATVVSATRVSAFRRLPAMGLIAGTGFLFSTSAFAPTSFALLTTPSYAQNAGAKIRLEFRAMPEQLEDLRSVLTKFAASEGFRVEDYGKSMPPRNGRPLFWLRLFRSDLIEIQVINIRSPTRMFVWFYNPKNVVTINNVAIKLEQILRADWPDIAPYEGL